LERSLYNIISAPPVSRLDMMKSIWIFMLF
jgi:hypothetical protein